MRCGGLETASGNKGVGRLSGVTEESGSSAFTYDAKGRLIQDSKTIQGKTYAVQYAYDKNGRVTGITLPSGRAVTFVRATDGLVTDITTKATPLSASEAIATGVTYKPFGPLEGLTYGNGLALTQTYDQNYWLTRTEVKATGVTRLDLTFGRNEDGQLTAVTDNASAGRGASFSYTDAGRLGTASGSWGDHTYTYDAAGNRVGKTVVVGATTVQENLVLAGASNRVDSTQQPGGPTTRTLTWRTGGDLSQAVLSGGTTYNYAYNARKRLNLVKLNGIDRAQYGYDFRGLRVWRTVLATTPVRTHYVFDPEGHLLAEHDGATGAVVHEYVWLDDRVIAVIDGSTATPVTYFIHTGQLDEPLVMTDAAKAEVWDAYVEPFGQAQVLNSTTVDLGLRLPGQWEEAETGGLFQNWNRNYDPSLGRYVESDPIGLGGGQNVYGYVDGDPLSVTDPLGLHVRVAVSGSTVTMTLPIQYRGPGADPATIAKFNSAIERAWSGKFGTYNVRLRVVKPTFMCLPWEKNVIDIPLGNGRAFVRGGNRGVWQQRRPGTTAAHEAGHLMGLPDRYNDVPGQGSQPMKGYETNIMGAPVGTPTQADIGQIIWLNQ